MKGSIQKRARKTGGFTWSCVVDDPPDAMTGKRKQRRLSADTKRELLELVAKFHHDMKSGAYIAPSDETLRDYLNGWLQVHRPNIRETTYRSYEQNLRNHIVPALGNIPLQKLTAADLASFYSSKLGEGLAPRSVQILHTVVRQALQRAFKLGLVVRNVADMVEAPRASRPSAKSWTPDQVRTFLEAAKGARNASYGVAWIVGASTGLRRGEMLGLRWEDVDLCKGRIHIRQALIEVGGKLRIHEPKTKSGRHGVRLPPSVVDVLRAHKASQDERRLALGRAWRGQDGPFADLVFTTFDGGPIGPRNFHRRYKELLATAGLPDITLHGLRHSHATHLMLQRISPKVVSERLGHSSVTLTLDTYSHVLPDMQDEVAATVEAVLFGTKPKTA